MKNFDPPPNQIYMEEGPHKASSKMPIIEVITQLFRGNNKCFVTAWELNFWLKNDVKIEKFKTLFLKSN